MRSPILFSACLLTLACSGLLQAAETVGQSSEILMKDVLVIQSVSRPGRSAVRVDTVEAQIVAGLWRSPKAGDVVPTLGNSEREWENATANEQGVLKGAGARGGYVYWPVASDREQVMILDAAGYGCVYVNGEIRSGDSYGFGYLRFPVLLRQGTNEFLFQSGRGEFRAKLVPALEPLSIHTADSTLPDIIPGETEPIWGAVVLLNSTTNFIRASLRVVDEDSPEQFVNIPPLGIFKAPFRFRPPGSISTNSYAITLEAANSNGERTPARAELKLRVRKANESCMRTFVSEIDGSVQYYAVNPASGAHEPGKQGLFLSLHGAGVEARGQAESYYPKNWGHIVSPTNRRPYGFDWEEWGRWDALEVLTLAMARYQPDPARIYLTGHSMGGHGTWQLGVLYPDRFAAIAPSAGWISFRSYTGGRGASDTNTNPMQQMLLRASAASETLLMVTNYAQQGVYILHGDADDNVPVSQARQMRKVLGEFHRDFDFHEQPGAGHWWDASDEPGTDCVDWAPMFDFFARRVIAADETLRRVRFVTVNPAVSSRSHSVSILAQERQLEPSAVEVRVDPGKRRIVGTTTNVSRIGFEFPAMAPGPGLTIEIDGEKIEDLQVPAATASEKAATATNGSARRPALCLVREDGKWRVSEYPSAALKRPERSGPFREAFRNRMVLIYGTKGTPEENAWTLAKARYDAETFYYRGNATIELAADTDLVSGKVFQSGNGEVQSRSRNVILYGHAECNAAWESLLSKSPVQARRGRLQVGDRELVGEALGCLFLQPHPTDDQALVGVVAGTGMPGLRATERMPYFISGAGFPDCLVFGADLAAKGIDGLRAAGFFGEDWQVASGDFVWRDAGP